MNELPPPVTSQDFYQLAIVELLEEILKELKREKPRRGKQ